MFNNCFSFSARSFSLTYSKCPSKSLLHRVALKLLLSLVVTVIVMTYSCTKSKLLSYGESERPTLEVKIWGFPKIRGYLFGGPYNKDYSILVSTLILGNYHLGLRVCHVAHGCYSLGSLLLGLGFRVLDTAPSQTNCS